MLDILNNINEVNGGIQFLKSELFLMSTFGFFAPVLISKTSQKTRVFFRPFFAKIRKPKVTIGINIEMFNLTIFYHENKNAAFSIRKF